jgi:hypothetical protein
MIAFFGTIGLFYITVVFHKIGIPLVGFSSDKTIKAIEAHLKGPLPFSSTGWQIRFRYIMVLAHPKRTPSIILQYLPDGCGLFRNMSAKTRKAICTFGDRSHSI